MTSLTVRSRNLEQFAEQLSIYFVCEGRGNDPNNPCDRNAFRQLATPWLTVVSFVLDFLLPAVNLVYALNIKELKEKFNIMKALKFSRTTQTNLSTRSTS